MPFRLDNSSKITLFVLFCGLCVILVFFFILYLVKVRERMLGTGDAEASSEVSEVDSEDQRSIDSLDS
ncbi:hypothetical protein EJ05DRAFT_479911 [Pseudovirgaria hyperparasitica]|uniref:Uncharacterized protein n=1 Tax=Pseudovirgaria hyperparasitica TaxID=470096 RepID=A0A6A6VVJ3_9PEZI|nr:uncharacterized protein EJ05DRAFT_479911 [Pseudovirgaria hyperparasitica]KAF2753889.1 hypothetical protein EJ05DRAFT_479911 [Pseudovirgaria hyperparasitica]